MHNEHRVTVERVQVVVDRSQITDHRSHTTDRLPTEDLPSGTNSSHTHTHTHLRKQPPIRQWVPASMTSSFVLVQIEMLWVMVGDIVVAYYLRSIPDHKDRSHFRKPTSNHASLPNDIIDHRDSSLSEPLHSF